MIPDALVEMGTGLAPLAVRATVVLGAAALIYHVGLRRSSGAVRHLVLTATALALLLLPAVGTLLPTWTVRGQARGVLTLPSRVRPAWTNGDDVLAVETGDLDVPWLVRYRLSGS